MATYYSQLSRINDVEIGGTEMGEHLLPLVVDRFDIGKHAPYRRIRRFLQRNPVQQKYFAFCFVRNPFSRVMSSFNFLKSWLPDSHAEKAKKAFEEFADVNDLITSSFWREWDVDNMFKPQTFWTTSGDGETIVDYVGKVETLAEDIEQINASIKADLPPFDVKLNVTASKPDGSEEQRGFSRESVELILDRYASDFELFEYDETPPS